MNSVKQGSICHDKNCQEAQSVQIRSEKPTSNMQSVTNSSIPARTINLQGNIPRIVNIPSVCAMARTVNVPILYKI